MLLEIDGGASISDLTSLLELVTSAGISDLTSLLELVTGARLSDVTSLLELITGAGLSASTSLLDSVVGTENFTSTSSSLSSSTLIVTTELDASVDNPVSYSPLLTEFALPQFLLLKQNREN